MSNFRRTAPKRRIERVFSRVSFAIAATQTDIVLHTAEDSKTLVRMIIDLVNLPIDSSDGDTLAELMISKAPGGTLVGSASVSQALDQKPNVNEITRIPLAKSVSHVDATGSFESHNRIFKDIQAMRKMQENDTLVLSHIAGNANDIQVFGIVYMWFKE